MKILFTSDLHLDSKRPERIDALKHLIRVSGEESVDLMLISGDLFDSSSEAEMLRPVLRDLFSNLDFDVLVIPGNHDYKAYASDLNFGNDIRIADTKPYQKFEYGDVDIVAVPYENQEFEKIALYLKNIKKDKDFNILMLHCSLDIPSIREDDFGEEKKEMYLPVSSRLLGSLGFDYVFAGHFHTRFVENKLSENTIFYYSGSPVSVTKKEKGKRRALILDTEKKPGERIRSRDLDTFFYDSIELVFLPDEEEKMLEGLAERLSDYKGRNAEIYLGLKGLTSIPEADLQKKIDSVLKNTIGSFKDKEKLEVELSCSYVGVAQVLSDPLFKAFEKKLAEKDMDDETALRIRRLMLRQFSLLECD